MSHEHFEANEPSRQLDENSDSKPLTVNSLKDKKTTGSFVKRFLVYVSMTFVTFGLWSRFFPLRTNKKGGWGVYALFATFVIGALVARHYYEKESNQLIAEQFGEAAPNIKSLFFFENNSGADSGSITVNKDHTLAAGPEEITPLHVDDELVRSLRIEKANLEKEISELKEVVNRPPEMALISFDELDSIVGCTSKFAEQKKSDLFSEKFKGKWVHFKADIKKIEDSIIYLNNKSGVGLNVHLLTPGSGYNLLVGDELSITFKLDGMGSCEKPYTGTLGKF